MAACANTHIHVHVHGSVHMYAIVRNFNLLLEFNKNGEVLPLGITRSWVCPEIIVVKRLFGSNSLQIV